MSSEGLSFPEASLMIEQDRMEAMRERDQLSRVRADGAAFHHLTEEAPLFPPTYKFKPGTDVYSAKYVRKSFIMGRK